MRIPFVRVSQIRRLPWRCHSSTIVEDDMAVRKKEDEVFANAAGIDVGGIETLGGGACALRSSAGARIRCDDR